MTASTLREATTGMRERVVHLLALVRPAVQINNILQHESSNFRKGMTKFSGDNQTILDNAERALEELHSIQETGKAAPVHHTTFEKLEKSINNAVRQADTLITQSEEIRDNERSDFRISVLLSKEAHFGQDIFDKIKEIRSNQPKEREATKKFTGIQVNLAKLEEQIANIGKLLRDIYSLFEGIHGMLESERSFLIKWKDTMASDKFPARVSQHHTLDQSALFTEIMLEMKRKIPEENNQIKKIGAAIRMIRAILRMVHREYDLKEGLNTTVQGINRNLKEILETLS